MPGAMSSASLNSRRDVIGAARSSSPSMFMTLVGRVVSIIGDSPDTVIVSSRLPSLMAMSTVRVRPALMTMPSRRKVAKPVSSAVMSKVPGGRFSSR
jgi:hypothetical protein